MAAKGGVPLSFTRGQLKFDILSRLQKSSLTKGYYTDDKINSVIRESQDYIATEMFLADEGWMHKIDIVDTPSSMVTYPFPSHWAMIAEVRYLVGNVFVPMDYDQEQGQSQWSGSSGVVQSPSRYRIVDNQLYFNPAIGPGGAQTMMVEYFAYPRRLASDNDFLESEFDNCMYWFMVYECARMLAGQLQQSNDNWGTERDKWYNRMLAIINMRTRQCIPVRDFDG